MCVSKFCMQCISNEQFWINISRVISKSVRRELTFLVECSFDFNREIWKFDLEKICGLKMWKKERTWRELGLSDYSSYKYKFDLGRADCMLYSLFQFRASQSWRGLFRVSFLGTSEVRKETLLLLWYWHYHTCTVTCTSQCNYTVRERNSLKFMFCFVFSNCISFVYMFYLGVCLFCNQAFIYFSIPS